MSTNARPEQLTLLRTSDLPMQLRLDHQTRARGLAHIAEIRRQLAAMHATPETSTHVEAPRRAA